MTDNNTITFTPSTVQQATTQFLNWQKIAYSTLTPSVEPGSAAVSLKQDTHNAQWMRRLSIAVYASGTGETANADQGIELSSLRCTFHITKNTNTTPNTINAKIYNMSPQTMAKVIEFTRVQVSAGYKYADYGMIYDGIVVMYKRGKENATDTYLEIIGGDGEDKINRMPFLANFPAGTKDKEIIDRAVAALGLKVGYVDPDLGGDAVIRGVTFAEGVRDTLRDMMNKYGGKFFVDNGNVYIIRNDKYLPGEAVVLSPRSGLVGVPEVTPQGIHVRCLLNPKIRLGGLVRIDSTFLSGVPYTPGSGGKLDSSGNVITPSFGGKTFNNSALMGKSIEAAYTSPTGTYRIGALEYDGDTRGDQWYCTMICTAVDEDGRLMNLNNPSNVFNRRPSKEAVLGLPPLPIPALPPPIPPLPGGLPIPPLPPPIPDLPVQPPLGPSDSEAVPG